MLATFTVNSLDDDSVLPGVVTLRSAIQSANDNDNPAAVDNIRFDNNVLNGTIDLASALPTITEPVNIEVDPFFPFSSDRVTLNGANVSSGSGLHFNVAVGPSSPDFMKVEGLIIQDFPNHGIHVQDLPDDITFTVEFSTIDGNGDNGIHIDLPSNQNIVSWSISENIITNNTVGVRVIGIGSTKFNVDDNRIGTDGTSTGDGNSSHGIYMSDVSASPADSSSGIARNTISGNVGHGIFLEDTFFIAGDIASNEIGLDMDLTLEIPNEGDGIHLLGSGTELFNNTIGGNLGNGIVIDGSNSVEVFSNRIGTKLLDLNADFGNGVHGIQILGGSQESLIHSNVIYYNGGDGVVAVGTGTIGNTFSPNAFRNNAGIPIDLSDDGPTANDPDENDDSDTGPNNLLNYPVIDGTDINQLANGDWRVSIYLDVDIAGSYNIDFYRFDPSTEEHLFLSTAQFLNVVAGGDSLLATIDGANLSAGDSLTAVTTGNLSSGNNNKSTSEFPVAAAVVDAAPPQIVDVRLDGDWAMLGPYSFVDLSAAGDQLDSIFTQGVNKIEIEFNEPVNFAGDPLTLLYTAGNPVNTPAFQGFNGNVATWTISGGLEPDKYAIKLVNFAITDMAGKALDAKWDDPVALTDVLAGSGDIGHDWNNDQGKVFDPSNGVEGGNFRLHFAYLPGDYNQNGLVESGETGGDGDGDGDFGGAGDDQVVSDAISAGDWRLAAGQSSGDYNDNEIVENNAGGDDEFGDYELWKMTYSSTTDLRADGNNDGVVDTADYTVWRDNLGQFSAWSGGGGGGGAGGPIVQIGVAPMVTNVTISGSISTHDPYSFDAVDGSGEQLRTVPVGGADTISITFSEDVNLLASDLTLIGLTTANRPTVAEFDYDLGTMTATWRFETWIAADQYLISLSDAVSDVEGDLLDGEWINPASLSTVNVAVSEFPSGDGTMGGDFNFVFTLLPGDATLDNIYDSADTAIFNDSWMSGLINALFTDGDASGDGSVNSGDFAFLPSLGLDLQDISILGDLNGDNVVDALDADILYANRNLADPTLADGDLDGDGDIDINDLDLLFAQYGSELTMVS